METGNCTAVTSAVTNPSTTVTSSSITESLITSSVTSSSVTASSMEEPTATSKLAQKRMSAVDNGADTEESLEKGNSVSSPNKTTASSPLNNKSVVADDPETARSLHEIKVDDRKTQPKSSEHLQTESLDKSPNKSKSEKDNVNEPQSSSRISSNNNKSPLEALRESPILAGSSKPPQVRRYSSTTASPERPPLASFRKLSIQPRTTQYEPHPLLQGHNEQGRSLLEELFAEGSCHHELKLQPRGAQCEKSALLQRNAAGLTELEIYLQEREKELIRNPMTKAASVDSTGSTSARRAMMLRQQSMPETRPRLEPRTSQFEQHALLAEKDQTGMSLLDAFLQEKEQDIEQGSDNGSITSKGKCSEKCTCKNANCPICKGPKSAYSTPSSSGSHPPLMKKESSRETVIEPKANNKRVHFSESGEEEEDDGQNDQNQVGSDNTSTNNQKPPNENNTVVTMDKCKTMETKCKAKAKRKCVIS